jgi:hypothetical protein
MKLLSLFGSLLLVLLVSCDGSSSKTLIIKNQLGQLTPKTEIKDLGTILETDSIAVFDIETRFGKTEEIEIFDSEGKVSLIVEPKFKSDTLVTIDEIQILDSRYKTEKGLGIDSDFKVIYKNYKIDNIQNSINSVILSINEIGAYIVIDKKHLPSELRFDSEIKIEANQIPDGAPIKYFWLKFKDLD